MENDCEKKLKKALEEGLMTVAAFFTEDFGICKTLIGRTFPELRKEYTEKEGFHFVEIMIERHDSVRANTFLSSIYKIDAPLVVILFIGDEEILRTERCWGDATDQKNTICELINEALGRIDAVVSEEKIDFFRKAFVAA